LVAFLKKHNVLVVFEELALFGLELSYVL